MRLQILGSGAAEGFPAVFCGCAACRKARKLGGKNLRTRSGAQLGESHKIDFPPDSFSQALRYGLNWEKLEHLFFTHSHNDHFYPAEAKVRRPGFAFPSDGAAEKGMLNIYGNELVYQGLVDVLPDLDEAGIEFHELTAFQSVQAGAVTAIPLRAEHMQGNAFIYLFSQNGKTLLYALDTGWFPEQTWEFLAAGSPLDCVVLDCTFGPNPGQSGHMGLPEIMATRNKLAKLGLLTEKSLVVATHFSHHGQLTHDELTKLLNPRKMIAAYDGLILDF